MKHHDGQTACRAIGGCAIIIVLAAASSAARAGEEAAADLPVIPLASAPSAAPAAVPAESPQAGIAEIIVTAQKRAENINSVPIAINAYTGDDLQKLGVTDTRDLSKLVPGFTAANSGFSTPVYTLRGVGFTDPSQTSSATVGIYSDEFNLPYPTMSRGANVDLQRVEVLKGPQGTLYGRNTTAGLVNYIANKPTDRFVAGASLSQGRFDTTESEAYVSGPLADSLRARLALKGVYAGEGWQRSRTRYPDGSYDTLGRQAKAAGRALLDWQPGETLKLELGINAWLDRSEPQAPQVVGIVPQNPFVGSLALDGQVRDYPLNDFDTRDSRAADWPDQYRYSDEKLHFQLHDSFYMPTARADWTAGETTTITALADYKHYRANGSFLPQSGLDTVNSERYLYTTIRSYAFELRAAGDWGALAHWQLGANYSADRVDDTQDFRQETTSAVFPDPLDLSLVPGVVGSVLQSLVNGVPVFPLVAERSGFDGHQKVSTPAVFGNLQWHLNDRWDVTTGLRYTQENRDFNGCGTSSDKARQGLGLPTLYNAVSLALGGRGGATPGGCVTLDSQTNTPQRYYGKLDESNLGWHLALSWQPHEGALYYLSQSRGYKSGSFPSINISNSAQFAPVTQERLDAYEAGTKLTLLDRAVHWNFSAFYYDYEDKQVLATTKDQLFGPLPILANAPKSHVAGGETELQWTPINGLLLSGAATYLSTRIDEFSGLDPNGNPTDFAGQPFAFTPKWTATALLNYTRALSERCNLIVGLDATHAAKTNASLNQDPLYGIKAYTVANARIGLETGDGRWQLMAWGRNIFDAYYYNNVIRATDSVSRFTGMPLTYGLTLRYASGG